MEKKINIAELLKDCPKGMELDCTMFENVRFINVDEDDKPICIRTGDIYRYLTEFGTWTFDENAKCVIFPKGKTTWEGFEPPCKFKDGDIIFTHANCLKVGLGNTWISIFQEKRNGGVATYVDYAEDGSDYYSNIDGDKPLLCMEKDILLQRLATEEEKQKLFDAIKANGYKWNAETKTLEKLIEPKFKVGDRIRHKTTNKDDVYEISKVYDDSYGLVGFTWMIYMKYQDDYELVPTKFDITNFVPFESRVLVRHSSDNKWCGSFFSHIDVNLLSHCFKYVTIAGKSYPMCIPYEENKHLLGTTNDCDEFYKTW